MVIFAVFTQTMSAVFAEDNSFFEKKIRPILVEHCYACHNSLGKKKGGLALDYKDAFLKGGDSGDVIVSGKPKESILIWALRHEEGYEMPAKAPKLDDEVIRDFEKWVKDGAHDPRLTKPKPEDLKNTLPWEQVREQRKKWWSFQPLKDATIPTVKDVEWSKNSIDQFLFAQMQKEKISPAPEASPEILVRRLHLILVGLPPKIEVVNDFVKNYSPAKYEQTVDQLLGSKEFGERWARHWMDWYRYAESHGSEGDPPIPYAYQYRDYLIRALNADVSYDQLLREHLAGDLLENPRINKELSINESSIGPAHLRMVPHGFGVTDAYGEQITFTDNQVDVISKAMMGITVSCARCHNHKFDPISQKDFYRLYGVMVSNRPTTVLIDTKEKLETNKIEMASLKKEIKEEFAELWLSELDQLESRLDALPILEEFKKNHPKPQMPKNYEKLDRKKKDKARAKFNTDVAHWNSVRSIGSETHPLGLWTALESTKPNNFEKTIKLHSEKISSLKAKNKKMISNAEFYLDLSQQTDFKKWYSSGNGTTTSISPSGSFAIQADGQNAITGIYPAGVYSHLISDKHAAVLASANFTASGNRTMVRIAGRNSRLKVPIRNYPLTQGLHPDLDINNEILEWKYAQRKWKFWRGDQLHYELRTAKDTLVKLNQKDRSWFGITNVYAGNEIMLNEGASILEFAQRVEEGKDRASIIRSYSKTLASLLKEWKDNAVSNKGAEFLDTFVRLNLLANKVDQLPKSLRANIEHFRKLDAEIPIPKRAPGVLEAEPVDQPLLVRGEYKQESNPVDRQFLEIFSSKKYHNNSGRLELAADMVSEANTLKSRVLINRLWAYVYGRGIVSSTDNFGRLGEKPTHPELLDHLSLDFERNGWSIKQTLRKMVTSRTFRSSSQTEIKIRDRDPNNIYLSYFSPRRLDAEVIHDSIGFVSGLKKNRTIYSPVIRNRLDPFLATFNAPVPTATISSRNHNNVPAQSLAMLNGDIVEQAAREWSKRILQNENLKASEEKINAMFLGAYGRLATSAEMKLFLDFLESGRTEYHIAHALLNSKEFIYVY